MTTRQIFYKNTYLNPDTQLDTHISELKKIKLTARVILQSRGQHLLADTYSTAAVGKKWKIIAEFPN